MALLDRFVSKRVDEFLNNKYDAWSASKDREAFNPDSRYFNSDSVDKIPFETLVEQGYRKNNWCYSCISLIATAISNLPWEVFRDDAEGNPEAVPESPYAKLLQAPNSLQRISFADMMALIATDMELGGNAFVVGTQPGKPGGGEPAAEPLKDPRLLWVMPPSSITVLESQTHFGVPVGYEYQPGSGPKQVYPPGSVSHIRYIDPLTVNDGLAPTEAAWQAVTQHNRATHFLNELLVSDGKPPYVWSPEDTLDPDARRAAERFIDKVTGAIASIRKHFVAGAKLIPHKLSYDPVEMETIATKQDAKTEICSVYKVPPSLIGNMENVTVTSNIKETTRIFYQNKIMPLANTISSALNQWLQPIYNDNTYLGIDINRIEALQEDANERSKRDKTYIDIGAKTRNEIRAEQNLDNLGPIGDQLTVAGAVESLDIITGEEDGASPDTIGE